MVDRAKMRAQLYKHEGLRLFPYKDTEGFWTIGVGYNISSRGWDVFENVTGLKLSDRAWPAPGDHTPWCSKAQALDVLDVDIDRVEAAVLAHFPFYAKLSEVRQRVVLDMAFNMGFAVLGFKNARAAIEAQDWSKASRELYKSKWAHQVGDGEGGKFDRCDRLAHMLLTSQEPTDIPQI
jgi:lysozyme